MLQDLLAYLTGHRPQTGAPGRSRARPRLEALEDRTVPAVLDGTVDPDAVRPEDAEVVVTSTEEVETDGNPDEILTTTVETPEEGGEGSAEGGAEGGEEGSEGTEDPGAPPGGGGGLEGGEDGEGEGEPEVPDDPSTLIGGGGPDPTVPEPPPLPDGVYVVFGKRTGFDPTLDLTGLDGTNGFKVSNVPDDTVQGVSVTAAGDVNGDGLQDLFVRVNNQGEGAPVGGVGVPDHSIVTGPGKTGAPVVQVFRPDGTLVRQVVVYPLDFTGGVRVASGDVNGDGVMDIITAPGEGILTQVRVLDGKTLEPLSTLPNGLFPFNTFAKQGAYVAAADFDADGHAEIVVGTGPGGQFARAVKVFDEHGKRLFHFFPYGRDYYGGIRVAVGDLRGDDRPEIVVAKDNGPSEVKVFGPDAKLRLTFSAYDAEGGNHVAVGDIDGDGDREIIVGREGPRAPAVRIFNGRTGIREDGFLAYRRGFENGVGVAVLDVNGDGIDEIVTSPLDGATRVKVFRGDGKLAKGFRAYAPNFAGGAFVAGA